jgi:hypothetical protein
MQQANYVMICGWAPDNIVNAPDGLSITCDIRTGATPGVGDVEIDAMLPGNYCVLTGGFDVTASGARGRKR